MLSNPSANEMCSDPVVLLQDVWVMYNGSTILENISLQVCPREIVSIVGPNGAGKTTLLRVITGLIPPSRGIVRVLGTPPRTVKKAGWIGYIPQRTHSNRTFPLSVQDVVSLSIWARKKPLKTLNEEDRCSIQNALKQVDMSAHLHSHYGSLSEGQKQRVLIASALAGKPRLLIMDEPSTGLDRVAQDSFYRLLETIRDKDKISIIMVSHDIGTVSSIVDRIACLKRKIHFHGEPKAGIPPDALRRVFGQNINFLIHDEHCDTCEQDR